jgi:hypothetical protein
MNKSTSQLIALFFSACIMLSAVMLSSCKNDDETGSILPVVDIPTQFSDLSPEQNKANLEEDGVALINELEALKDSPGINTTESLDHFISIAGVPEGGRAATDNKAMKMMLLLAKFGVGKAKAVEVLKGFRTKEEPVTPKEMFDALAGIYTYNKNTLTWEYASGVTGRIVFKFPSTETGTDNNAELAIYDFTSKAIENEAAEYQGDFPTSLKADLSVNSTKQIQFSWTASYNNSGEPTSIVTSLTIGTFKLAYELLNTTTEIAIGYSLTKNGTNIVSWGAGAKGQFSSDAVSNSEGPSDVATFSNAYFQIMNTKFAGEVKIKELEDALETANTLDAQATAYNANMTFVVFYADSKKKIADTEFYVVPESDLENEHIDIRLIFADDSRADLEHYTETGFEGLAEEFSNFQEDLD